jgi:hypothetical protein
MKFIFDGKSEVGSNVTKVYFLKDSAVENLSYKTL